MAAHLRAAARRLAGVTVRVALQAHLRSKPDISRWVYLGEDTAWRISSERGPLAGVERVPIGDRIERLSRELRKPYIDLIGELSQQNASLEWWASELAAKNPFAMLYSRICALACARELLNEGLDDVLAVCSTGALMGSVAVEASRAGRKVAAESGSLPVRLGQDVLARRDRLRPLIDDLARVAPRGVLERARGPLARALDEAPHYRHRLAQELGARAEGDFNGVLLVTWADERSIAPDGSYRDPHFGSLPALLESHGRSVGYLPRVLPSAPPRATLQGLLRSGARLFLPEAWTVPADWRRADVRARKHWPQIPKDAELGGVPVTLLAYEHLYQLRRQQGWALAHEAVVRNLAAGGVLPELIVLPFEGHAWEQVVIAAVHEHMPGTRVVGYDNVNFSRLALSLYPAAGEIGLRPLPDVVVTNGPLFADVLAAEGFPRERIRVGCGLRHEYVWQELAEPAARPKDAPLRVLAAASIDAGESVELIEKAVAAFGGEGFELTIKLHPAVNREAVFSRLSPSARASHFRETPIAELLGSADVMLYTYSVVCYEALAQGVAPLFVKAESFLDLDQLEPFPELGWRARTVEELRAAANEIAARHEDERRRWRERAREALGHALRPVTPDCASAFLEP